MRRPCHILHVLVGHTGTRTIPLVGHTVTVPDTLLVASLLVVGLPVVPVVPPLVVPLARAHICGSARVVGSITDPVGTITSGSVRLVSTPSQDFAKESAQTSPTGIASSSVHLLAARMAEPPSKVESNGPPLSVSPVSVGPPLKRLNP